MINVRRLAAVDLRFLGAKFIVTEFAVGVIGPAALGIPTLLKSHSIEMTLFGGYLISLGVNYTPLLLHAISILHNDSEQAELEEEPRSRTGLFRKYRRQSLWVLVPIVVPVVAIRQQRQRLHAQASSAS